MKIETKLNIGDEVWVLWENRIRKSKVTYIIIHMPDPNVMPTQVEYQLDGHNTVRECDLGITHFLTKEELIQYISK